MKITQVLTISALVLGFAINVTADEEHSSIAEAAGKMMQDNKSGMLQGSKPSSMMMQGGMMSLEHMQKMQEHMEKMEQHMVNMETLLKELVELQKAQAAE